MAWTIAFLNDLIKHPSDITIELLTKNGVTSFNEKGIVALKELIRYKNMNEQNKGTGNRESLFVMDTF